MWGYETEAQGGFDLQYLYQRYYDPQIGRFISRDPIRWAGGLNLYGYTENDPVGFVDATGTAPTPQHVLDELAGDADRLDEEAQRPLGGSPDLVTIPFTGGGVFGAKILAGAARRVLRTIKLSRPRQAVGKARNVRTVKAKKRSAPVKQLIVRRYMSASEYKSACKNGIDFDGSKRGIPTTSAAREAVDPDKIRKATGARNADYYIDYDVTGLNVLQKRTKGGWLEYVIRGNLDPGRIVGKGRVPVSMKSRR